MAGRKEDVGDLGVLHMLHRVQRKLMNILELAATVNFKNSGVISWHHSGNGELFMPCICHEEMTAVLGR